MTKDPVLLYGLLAVLAIYAFIFAFAFTNSHTSTNYRMDCEARGGVAVQAIGGDYRCVTPLLDRDR